ncbi:polysaccharide biosynthesis/export family protein [uncultured Ruegeria sp.]|uniref:polysaccharide biosynthesis/export family protein n=1 Tax=uncultured Ruegeria sp. TaxID=259304 RepID=UPI00261B0D4B|nr:polysaccharide biosynthesis/export family protein [uncultured Ruegeria sp.]
MNSCFRIFLLIFAMAASSVLAEGYRLLPQDRVSLKAMRWDSASTTYVTWDGVTGEYSITGDGTLMVPLVGQVEAEGHTPAELAALLELKFRRQIGMAEPPRIALEVVGHLPIYVLGDVNSPGAYDFHFGITAQQVLALAGGTIRPPIEFSSSNDFQILRMGGEIRLLSTQIGELEQEKQRLVADLAILESDENSGELPEPPTGLEGEILKATMSAREGVGERIQDLQNLLKEQISSLTTQLELRNIQIANVSKELENLNSLKEKGLTVSNRVTTMTNQLNDLESKRLDQEVALLVARQDLNRAERDALELDDNARSDTLVQLNSVESELASLKTRLETATTLHGELAAAGLLSEDDVASETIIEFVVTRGVDGQTQRVTGTDLVRPGDTIEVVRRTVLTSN